MCFHNQKITGLDKDDWSCIGGGTTTTTTTTSTFGMGNNLNLTTSSNLGYQTGQLGFGKQGGLSSPSNLFNKTFNPITGKFE